MRPKSIATVVVCLSGTAAVSSTPSDAAVMVSSVRSGGISETARTSVVFPTPNPPATRILSGMSSAGTQTIQESGEDLRRGAVRVPGGVDGQVPGLGQVADQHPRHADRHAEARGHLDEGDR